VLLIAVGLFIATHRSASQTVRTNTVNSAVSTAASAAKPLDQLSSAQIALNVAQMAKLAELTPIRNQADSDSLLLAVAPTDTTILAKPQVVATAARSKKDIIHYTVKDGDSVDSLAAKYHVSADSIRWSNNITGNNLSPGKTIVIPPVTGIVYTVKVGDTPASLAKAYHADEGQIISYNDAEINGLQPGEQIIIPNGHTQAVITYGVFSASYGGNGYDFGYCTWYVASKIAVPTNWGNANTWATYAALSGWNVSSRPTPGAIAQTSRGWAGHVAIVHEVSSDGSMIKYSDMNGLAGWNREGFSDWMPASTFEHYISH
jgi:surface antigen